ncbi:MAG TPA: response regulator [Nitrospiria bacterium]|nr:response regulator [Nitrospiria bacterium]
MCAAPAHEADVLIIEDEPEIRRFLSTALSQHGYRVHDASSGRGGLAQATSRNPDLILLDLGLPDLDGLDVIRRLRTQSAIPVIVLSARDQERSKVEALDLGADDYVTKPFGMDELLARMRVVLRHAARAQGGAGEPVFTAGALCVDLEQRRVSVSGKQVHLTPIEYKLLAVMVQHAGKVLTHRQLLQAVWGPLHQHEAHYVRVYMQHLRNKLEANPARPRYLLTELGVGYRLRTE